MGLYCSCATYPQCISEVAPPRQEEQVGERKKNLGTSSCIPERLLSSAPSVVASLSDLHWWQSLLES